MNKKSEWLIKALLSNPIWYLIARFEPQWRPWVADRINDLLTMPRERFQQVAEWAVGVTLVLFGLVRLHRTRGRDVTLALSAVRSKFTVGSIGTEITRGPGNLSGNAAGRTTVTADLTTGSPPGFPTGTVGALATAMQRPLPRAPMHQFVNNSGAMQWEAYRRHQDLQSRAAIDSTMNRNIAHLLPPGRA